MSGHGMDTPLGKIRIFAGQRRDSLAEKAFTVEELPAAVRHDSNCLFCVDRRARLTPAGLESLPFGAQGIWISCLLMRSLDSLGGMSEPESGECYQAMSLYEGSTKLTIGCVNQSDSFEGFDFDNPGAMTPAGKPGVYSLPSDDGKSVGVTLGIADASHMKAFFIVSWLNSRDIDTNDAQTCIAGGKDIFTYLASDPFYLRQE